MTKLFLTSRKVKLEICSECKYTAGEDATWNEVVYDYCTGFEVVSGKEADEIEANSDGSCIDDNHEYLILFFEDGDTATFRNSYVDLFAR